MQPTVTVAREAMATRFEVLLHGGDPAQLRAAGEQALDEIDRLEAQLSVYRPTSEIARVNRHAADRPVRVSPPVLRLLERAQRLWAETGGAFDPTVGPLVRCWGFMEGTGRMADPRELEAARACVGMDLVDLDVAGGTVRYRRPGVMLDLGAIGKGYAIDCAVECLREAGVTSGLVHGGTSSVAALGAPPDAPEWRVGIEDRDPVHGGLGRTQRGGSEPGALLAEVSLRDACLGVSAVWGRHFAVGGRVLGHVLDPRLGRPVEGALMAAVATAEATEADALSTALLVRGEPGFSELSQSRPGLRQMLVLVADPGGARRCVASGFALRA